MSTRLWRWGARSAILLAGSMACSEPATVEPDTLEVAAEGRAERGLSLVLHAITADADTLPPGTVVWRVEPENAGTWRGDTLRLARAGRIRVVADYQGRTGRRTIEVAVPPTILFDMIVAGNRDLYRASLDGGDLVRLTTHPGADYDPTVAGHTVVFVSERDGNAELYSLSLVDGSKRRLTRTGAKEFHPALSPDGARLAFARGSGLSRLYVAAADATGERRPDPTHGHDGTLEIAPAWSPDGRTLAFVSTAGGNPDLFVWSGGEATFLEGTDAGEFEPAWSPDGKRIAFSSNRTGDVELYLFELETGTLRQLTERQGGDGYAAWLPDGRIVYVAYEGSTPELRWLDPERPGLTHRIPLPGEPRNPVALPR